MKILIASDSFKDALDAKSVCAAIAQGIRGAMPAAQLVEFPLADGGEGTMDILLHHLKGKRVQAEARDPLNRLVKCNYGICQSEQGEMIGLVEMAQASGLHLLAGDERKAIQTSTFGTGELISRALDSGVRKIILAIGGSATNDGGMGMAQALGFQFLDESGSSLNGVGANLGKVREIDTRQAHPRLKEVDFSIICDVDNPLTGPRGATRVYGPQKGGSKEELDHLESGMIHYAQVLEQTFKRTFDEIPGAGAAGGMGAASMAYLNGVLRPGVELVMELSQFEHQLEGVSCLITGEGRIDEQTINGKLVRGICKLASSRNIPVIALCGSLKADAEIIEQIGLKAAFSISSGALSLNEALQMTKENLEQVSRQLFSLLSVSLK